VIEAMTAYPFPPPPPGSDPAADAASFPYTGPEAMRASVESALRHVVDPEVAMSILDVGLVYGVDVTDERLHVRVTMTSAACPVTDLILEEIEIELEEVATDGQAIDVELVWDPPWSSDRMSARAKAFMGW
jgi:metal-sulfur cluster biosynthetic enzyme